MIETVIIPEHISTHSGGGGCVAVSAVETAVPDLTRLSLAEALSDPATAAVRARIAPAVQDLHLPAASVFSAGAFNSRI